MLYRLYTEDVPKNRKDVECVVSRYYPGYTIVKGTGFWRVQKERSLIIEIVTESEDAKITRLAKEVKTANKQQAVLVQRIRNSQWIV